ncbi:MAG TPA: GlsB/YeaQ/YmgE family stress response membrane protein [Candidatus Obscuribacterales bacterium]
MTLLDLLLLLLIAGICGGLAQSIVGYTQAGCLGSIVLGFIGAVLGTWLARTLELPSLLAINVGGEVTFPIVWSVIGAVLFVAILSLLTRPRRL